ncbi:MAG: hypothetical protein ACXVEE_25200 [Polyangiales bacterium]
MTSSMRKQSISLFLAFSVALGSLPAFAAPSEQEQAIAKDLFDKGVRLMEEGKCDESPPKDLAKCKEARDAFKRAYEITGALGALRNLAYTEKGLGMVASAARDFREVARRAPLDPKPERHAWADFAKKEVEQLEPRVPHLVIKVPERVPGLKITLDGVSLGEGAWDTPIAVDPGKHDVHAEAPGRLAFEGTTTLAEKQNKTIAIDVPAQTNTTEKKAGNKTLPLVVGAVGVVAVGVGLGIGYASKKKRDDSCDATTKLCDPQGLDDGRSLANTSTIVTGVGAALLVTGVVWYVLTPSTPAKDTATTFTPWASRDGGGLAAIGRF